MVLKRMCNCEKFNKYMRIHPAGIINGYHMEYGKMVKIFLIIVLVTNVLICSQSMVIAGGASAHRGDHVKFPPNTILAIRSAVIKGAHQVEFDVKSTKDKKLVIMHDWTVDKTTNGTGKVADLTLSEIRMLDAGSWFSPLFKNVRVPTLCEVLEIIPAEVQCNVHVHGGPDTAVLAAELIAEMDCLNNCFLTLGMNAYKEMAAARNAVPSIKICKGHPADSTITQESLTIPDNAFSKYRIGIKEKTFNRKIDYFQLFGSVDSYQRLTESVNVLHSNDIVVNYCCASTEEKIKLLIDAGVDFILTDDLDACLMVLKDMQINTINFSNE